MPAFFLNGRYFTKWETIHIFHPILISILAILAPKKAKKNTFPDPNFGPANDKNAVDPFFGLFGGPKRAWEALSQIFGKSNFLGQFDYKKGPKCSLG